MKKAAIILSIFSVILVSQLSAVDDLNVVAKDDFPATGTTDCPNQLVCKGWSSGNAATIDVVRTAGSYSLRIARGENATKTFFFPNLKIGQAVTVKFVFGKSNVNTNAYTLNTKLNNETHSISFSNLTGAVNSESSTSSAQYFKEFSYSAKLDVDKKLKIDFAVSAASGTYYGYINSVTIIANGTAWIDDAQIEQNFDSDANMIFTVHNPSGIAAEIEYETNPLNAQPDIDYESAAGNLTFGNGETQKTISVKILQHADPLTEDKRFAVSIVSDDVYIMDAEAIGTIKAHPGAVSIEDAGFIYAGRSGVNSTAIFTLSNSYSTSVSVNYTTVDITAQSGINYAAQSGTITVPPGRNTQSINITVIGNDTLTTQKEFKVTLSGAHLTRQSAAAVLYGDDNAQNSTGTNRCSTADTIGFLNNVVDDVSGVIRGSMSTGKVTSASDAAGKGRFFKFTAGKDARVEITYKAISRTMDFIQTAGVSCSSNSFFSFADSGASTYYYVLKADQKFDLSTTVIPANNSLSWWLNPEGEINRNTVEPRRVEHSVMHVKRGQTAYIYAGAYNSASSTVTSDYEIYIKYMDEKTDIEMLPENSISAYTIVNPLSTRNLYGNIKLIGNSFLCITKYGDGASELKKMIDAGLLTRASGELCIDDFAMSANWKQMPYLDMDSDPSTYNSVMAKLSTPSNSKVVWAGLFWTGMVDRNSPKWFHRHRAPYRSYTDLNDYYSNSYDIEKILLKTPGSSNYQEVYAQKIITVKGDDASMFGAYKDITDMINTEAADGEYWVANFRGSEALNQIGNYGGWSMVVIYEEDINDPNIEGVFRNLSVFNGFGRVTGNKDFKIDGFLTPKNGDVDAFLHIFAGEGELDKTSDYIRINPSKKGSSDNYARDNSKYPDNFIATHPSTLTDAQKRSLAGKPLSHISSSGAFSNSNNNIMAGTIGKADRYPITLNGNGIDLKSIDIGEHMPNRQDTLTVTLNGGGGDYFYPSMVATSVQLYDPDICYEENVTYNGAPIQAGNLPPKNGIVEYTLILKHKEHEDAENVTVRKTFMEEYGLEYVASSIQVKNSFDNPSVFNAKTDASGDDTAQYSGETMLVNIGRGATATEGGTIRTVGNVSDMVEVKYKAKLTTNNTIKENVYLIDYSNTELQLDFKNRPIKKCYDFSNTYDPGQPPIGAYRAVHEQFSKTNGNSISSNAEHSDNALYTQIAGKPFNIKLVFADTSGIIADPTFGGSSEKNVEIDLIEYPDYETGDTDEEKRTKCSTAASYDGYGQYNITGSVTEMNNITVGNAYKKVTFRIKDMETNDTSCSLDPFAVRPAQFNIDDALTTNVLIGGRVNSANLTAVKIDGNTTTSYNQAANIVSIGNTTLDIPPLCTAIGETIDPAEFSLTNGDFVSGVANMTAMYNNVGIVKTNFVDNNWAETDQTAGKGDCYADNATNTHINSKIGCDITTAGQTITFVPKDFFAYVVVSGPSAANFVYLSNNASMSARVATQITARLDDNSTAENYHQNCFADNVTYAFRLINDNITDWDKGYRNGTDPRDRVMFFEIDGGNAQMTENNNLTIGLGRFGISQGNFVQGEARSIEFGFNFGREIDKSEEPFLLSAALDLGIQDSDIQDSHTTATNATIADANITFFYGRVFIADKEGLSPITADVNYELYCVECNWSRYGLALGADLSKEDSNWWINRRHNNGNFGNLSEGDYDPMGNATIDGAAAPGTVSNGIGTVTIKSPSDPNHIQYQDTIYATPDDWLIYNRHDPVADKIIFTVKFIGEPGGWAGEGAVDPAAAGKTTGVVIGTDPDNKTKSRMSW
jgi:hypothetical protein